MSSTIEKIVFRLLRYSYSSCYAIFVCMCIILFSYFSPGSSSSGVFVVYVILCYYEPGIQDDIHIRSGTIYKVDWWCHLLYCVCLLVSVPYWLANMYTQRRKRFRRKREKKSVLICMRRCNSKHSTWRSTPRRENGENRKKVRFFALVLLAKLFFRIKRFL